MGFHTVVAWAGVKPCGDGIAPGDCSERSEQRPLVFPLCSPILYRTPVGNTPMKLSRKAIDQGLDNLPLSVILGKQVSDGLTPSQRTFAKEVARGQKKSNAYREAYPNAKSPNTLNREPYMLMRDPRIIKEVEAYTLALEAEKHRTPAALRSLVIQQLTEHALDKDIPPAQRIKALQLLGTVAEVGAFVELKQVRTITSSDDARARVMSELRGLLTSSASDATIIEADSLLQELAGDNSVAAPSAESGEPPSADPPHPDPPEA